MNNDIVVYYVCVRACACACVCVCLCVRVYVCVCMCWHACVLTYVLAYVYIFFLFFISHRMCPPSLISYLSSAFYLIFSPPRHICWGQRISAPVCSKIHLRPCFVFSANPIGKSDMLQYQLPIISTTLYRFDTAGC